MNKLYFLEACSIVAYKFIVGLYAKNTALIDCAPVSLRSTWTWLINALYPPICIFFIWQC